MNVWVRHLLCGWWFPHEWHSVKVFAPIGQVATVDRCAACGKTDWDTLTLERPPRLAVDGDF